MCGVVTDYRSGGWQKRAQPASNSSSSCPAHVPGAAHCTGPLGFHTTLDICFDKCLSLRVWANVLFLYDSAHILCTVLLSTLADEVLGSKRTTKQIDLWTPHGVSIWLTGVWQLRKTVGWTAPPPPKPDQAKREAGYSSLKQDSLLAGWWLKMDSGFVPRHKTLAACLFLSS